MKETSLVQKAIIAGAVILVSVVVLFFALRAWGGSGETQIVLNNAGECPQVYLILQSGDGQERLTLLAEPGQRETVDVRPGMVYEFQITTSPQEVDPANPNQPSDPCNLRDEGRITVPDGASHTFNIASEPAPTFTPHPLFDAQVVLNNTGECPQVSLVLRTQAGDEELTLQAAPGQSEAIKVETGVAYDYEVTTGDDDSDVCAPGDTGQINVSSGTSYTFDIDSEGVTTSEASLE